MMNDKSKILAAIAIGAIAGAALVKLFETNEGKEFVESAKKKAKSTADDLKNKINQLEKELSELLQSEKNNDTTTQA